jgi:hypothetical protein
MVRRSLKAGERRVGRLVASSLGACATAVVVVIELVTKFTEGAWISALLIVALVFLFLAINRHYRFYARQLSTEAWQPSWPEKHFVVVPVAGVSRSTANALAYALLLSPNIRAVAVATDPKQVAKLQDEWDLWDSGVPLEVLVSPYRAIVRPLLQYIDQLEGSEKPDWLTVVLPEVVPARWWHAFLHNQTVFTIKAALMFRRHTVVTSVRYHL